jgi:hypothetical protein
MVIKISKSHTADRFVRYNESKLEPSIKTGEVRAECLQQSLDFGDLPTNKIQAKLRPGQRRSVNPKAKNKFAHIKVAVSPKDNLSNADFLVVSKEVLKEFNMMGQPSVVYRHYDTKHPHIHIVVDLVNNIGKLMRFDFSHYRGLNLSRRLERELGIEEANKRSLNLDGKRPVSHDESIKQEKSGEQSWKSYIHSIEPIARQGKPSFEIYKKRLARFNISTYTRLFTPNKGEESQIGLSFGIIPGPPIVDMVGVKDSQNSYSFPNGMPSAEGLKPQNSFQPFSVRASTLGDYYTFRNLEKSLSYTDDLSVKTAMVNIHGKRYSPVLDESPDPLACLMGESKAQSTLITGILIGSVEDVYNSLLKGASVNDIDTEEKHSLPAKRLIDAVLMEVMLKTQGLIPNLNTVEKPKSAEFIYNSILDQAGAQYKIEFGRSPNKATRDLLYASLRNSFSLTDKAILVKGTGPLSEADPRIIPNPILEKLEISIQRMISAHTGRINLLMEKMPELKPLKDREQSDVTEQFLLAVRRSNVEEVKKLLNTDAIDFARIKDWQIARLRDNELRLFILERIKEAELAAKKKNKERENVEATVNKPQEQTSSLDPPVDSKLEAMRAMIDKIKGSQYKASQNAKKEQDKTKDQDNEKGSQNL